MSDDEHAMFFAELHVFVRLAEIVAVLARVHRLPLQRVFRTDRVELRRNDGIATLVPILELGTIQSRSDSKTSLIGVFERGGSLPARQGQRRQNKCESFHE